MKKIFIVIGSSGLIGSHIVKELKQKGDEFYAIDKQNSKDVNYVSDLSSLDEIVKIIANFMQNDFAISLIYAAGKNGSVEKGALDNLFGYDKDDFEEYINQNVLIPYDLFLRVIFEAKKHSAVLRLWLLCSHYSLVGANDSLYNENNDQKIKIKPHGYIISKHAAVGVVRSLASTYGDNKITINGFIPGGVKNNQDSNFLNKYRKYVPVGYMCPPEEMARWIVCVASPELSYANGSLFTVDGGVTSW